MTLSGSAPAGRVSAWHRCVAFAALLLGFAAAHADDIVVGQVAPFSGPQAVTGQAIRAGAQLYFDAVNARGGVHGHQIRLVTRDDMQKREETVRLTRALIASDAPVALIGSVSTSSLEALAKDGVLAQTSTALVGAVTGAQSLIGAPNIFIVKASYHDEVDRLFKQMSSLGQTRVALVYQDDGFGQDVLHSAEAAAAKHGITLVARSSYARNTVAVDKAVAEIAKAQPQVVFVGATTAAAIEFVRQYRQAKGAGTLYGMSVIDTDAVLRALGPDGVHGYGFTVVLPLQQQVQRGVVREYVKLRSASTDKNLSSRSMEGFIAAKALVKVLEGVPSATPAAVSAALARAHIDLGDYPIDFTDRTRTGSSYVDFAMFGSDGKIVR
jgi:branched-chain amino acid transport system substrate-binding protein